MSSFRCSHFSRTQAGRLHLFRRKASNLRMEEFTITDRLFSSTICHLNKVAILHCPEISLCRPKGNRHLYSRSHHKAHTGDLLYPVTVFHRRKDKEDSNPRTPSQCPHINRLDTVRHLRLKLPHKCRQTRNSKLSSSRFSACPSSK